MEAQQDSTTAAGTNDRDGFLSQSDADELLVITGQIRRCATMPPGNRLLFNALSALEELRERVTRPHGFRRSDELGDEIVNETHPY